MKHTHTHEDHVDVHRHAPPYRIQGWMFGVRFPIESCSFRNVTLDGVRGNELFCSTVDGVRGSWFTFFQKEVRNTIEVMIIESITCFNEIHAQ